MKVFLDTSVILAACCSKEGASRDVFDLAGRNGWALIVTPYVIDEVRRNLARLPAVAAEWPRLEAGIVCQRDVLTFDWPVVFRIAKDRPILFSAWAWSDVLLTLDRRDFNDLLGGTFYGLSILKPGDFLERERRRGRLR